MTKEDILIVDDEEDVLELVRYNLDKNGYTTETATNGEKALAKARAKLHDLIILDLMLPGIDGFETCRRLKNNKITKDIPVIFMSALSDTIDKVKGFATGGVDYVTKPFDQVELIARVRTHVELHRYQEKIEISNQRLLEINKELQETQKQLEFAAKTDPLTQLPNRRDMLGRIEYEKIRFERSHQPFTLALCDIDDFKRINDTFGHDCGDVILVTITRMMRSTIRKQDHLARWGGEEFLFVFPETDLGGARVVWVPFSQRSQISANGAHTSGSWANMSK